MPRRFATAAVALSAVLLLGACQPAPPPPRSCTAGIVGDSLTHGVSTFQHSTPHAQFSARGCELAWIDGKGGRKTGEGVDIIRAKAAAGQLPYVLIVGLGTNDRYELDQFPARVDEVIRLAAGRQIIWINVRYPGVVEQRVNAVLADRERRHTNFSVIDWRSEFNRQPHWDSGDGIHATRDGYTARGQMMAERAWQVTK